MVKEPDQHLTRGQQHLISEIEAIASVAGTDFWNVHDHPGYKTEFLTAALRQLVNAMVIKRYTMIDEYLTMIICDFYFPRRKREKSYGRLWKERPFRIFNHFLLDETTTIVKMNMVKAISPTVKY